jgi:hypothetical protein
MPIPAAAPSETEDFFSGLEVPELDWVVDEELKLDGLLELITVIEVVGETEWSVGRVAELVLTQVKEGSLEFEHISAPDVAVGFCVIIVATLQGTVNEGDIT